MLRFPCAGCDKIMNVADEHAGKKAKCPACGEVVVIPLKSILPAPAKGPPAKSAPTKPPAGAVSRKPQQPADDNGEEDRKPASQISRKPMPAPAKLKAKAPPPDDEDEDIPEVEAVDEEEDFEEAEEVEEADEDEEEEERPRKKKSNKKKSKKYKPIRRGGTSASEAGGFSYSIIGGLLIMILAVVWFVGGLMVGILFFYPPILFIVGVVAFINGLIRGNVAGE